MADNAGRKTEITHWDAAWKLPVRARIPSKLNVDVLNKVRLLRKHVRPGDRYIEIGCAPGKMLAWVASELKADVTGLDYSETGIANSRALFKALGMKADLVQDDFFNHHLPPASFDVVASYGLLEHFDDAAMVVRKHLDLVKPGGRALICVPNYGGVYGRLQRFCDASNLELHNLKIMEPQVLEGLVEGPDVEAAHAYPFGALSPWLISLEKKLPPAAARMISLVLNALGLVLPFGIAAIAPMLVLEVRMKK